MSKSVLRAVGQAYGLEPGVQTRVSSAMQSKMGLTCEEIDFLRSLTDCWLVVRMDDFDKEVQLSFFILCRRSSSVGASLRMTKKTRGLRYMQEANFDVFGGTPIAHCTVLLRKRRRSVVLSFLEKDLTRRTRGLNFGPFLVGVALRASAPFCPMDADMLVEAADNGSGRLVAFYEKLGFSIAEGAKSEGLVRMRGAFAEVLAACSYGGRVGVAAGAACAPASAAASRPAPMEDITQDGSEDVPSPAEHLPGSPVTDELCAICIELLGDADDDDSGSSPASAKRRCTLACGHRFHSACINRWLANSRQCPLCKRSAALQRGGG